MFSITFVSSQDCWEFGNAGYQERTHGFILEEDVRGLGGIQLYCMLFFKLEQP